MGWSLKGILQGAAAGAADWAVRGQAADLQAERDAAQFERSKEMARYNDELGGARSERMAELQQKFKDKAEMGTKESQSSVMELAKDEAVAKGLKAGSGEFNKFMADFAYRSGETGLGDKFMSYANVEADNARADRATNASLAATAEARRGREQSREDAKDAALEKRNFEQIARIGNRTVVVPDEENPGKMKKVQDSTGTAALLDIYNATSNMGIVSEVAARAEDLIEKNPNMRFGKAINLGYQQAKADHVAKKNAQSK